ncbi:MAG TPA: trypsin-like peptidase domain-containing protein [Pirellulales bacterium]|nr:trypsin-like peptidase domain-containing protein [Pirellulales bacterium]
MSKIWLLMLSALVLPCAVGVASAQQQAQNQPAPNQPSQNQPADDDPQAAADLELVLAIERVVARSIQRAEKSVVSIARRSALGRDEQANRDTRPPDRFGDPRGIGVPRPVGPGDPDFVPNEFATGVVVDRDGLVLTNIHVLGDELTDEYWVTTAQGRSFHMRIKATDPRSDLAVLEVIAPQPNADDFAPIRFGDGAKLRKGQFVVALGNPYAIARDGQVSASWGIVANLSRKAAPPTTEDAARESPKTLHQFGTLIQTDARLNLGTSGGALVDLRGDMVGLTTSQAALAGFEQSAGYAIAVDDTFLRAVETLKQGREVEYGLLGIEPFNFVDSRGRHVGALVAGLRSGWPAHRAGINNGDVVTHVDGHPIHDADGLRLQIGRLPAAATATLTLVRDGQPFQKRVTLSKFPVDKRRIVTRRPPAWRGLRVEYPTALDLTGGMNLVEPQLRFNRGGFPGTYVTVTEVESESPAAKAGLRPGASISHAAGTPLETPDDFRRAVADKSGPVKISVVKSTGEIEVVTIAPEEP